MDEKESKAQTGKRLQGHRFSFLTPRARCTKENELQVAGQHVPPSMINMNMNKTMNKNHEHEHEHEHRHRTMNFIMNQRDPYYPLNPLPATLCATRQHARQRS
jgi:hypothetical protein